MTNNDKVWIRIPVSREEYNSIIKIAEKEGLPVETYLGFALAVGAMALAINKKVSDISTDEVINGIGDVPSGFDGLLSFIKVNLQ